MSILERARQTLLLDHTFFASVLLRHPMVADNAIPTACINDEGEIRYNPKFIESLTVNQTLWVLCHEILHYVGLDALRIGERDPQLWNEVADAWINDTLNSLGIGERVPGCIDQPGAAKFSRETLYERAEQKKKQQQPQQGGGDPLRGDVIPSDKATATEQAAQEAEVKLEIAQAAQDAKIMGGMSGALQKLVTNVIDSKVPWFSVLERLLTERVKTDVSWTRPNRRYLPDHYLPTINGIGTMGELVIQIDISGSINPRELDHYAGHVKRIIEDVRPSKVHVLYTDTQVRKHEEFDAPEDVELTFRSGGGTDMRAGFRFLLDKGIDAEAIITLTDGYTPFPREGDYTIPSFWCISSGTVSPVGETVPFERIT